MKFSAEPDALDPSTMDWSLVGDSMLEAGVAAREPRAIAEAERRGLPTTPPPTAVQAAFQAALDTTFAEARD